MVLTSILHRLDALKPSNADAYLSAVLNAKASSKLVVGVRVRLQAGRCGLVVSLRFEVLLVESSFHIWSVSQGTEKAHILDACNRLGSTRVGWEGNHV